jgi:hypothetical protein
MPHLLEENMKRAQTQIQFINHEQKFVGPIHPGYDYTYDDLMLWYWESCNGLPKTGVVRGKWSSASRATFRVLAQDLSNKAQVVGAECFNVAKQFKTFDEFKTFIKS